MYVLLAVLHVALTVFVNLLDNLLERGRLDLESHHGENVADVVRRNGPLLVGEAVEASLQDVDLVAVQAHVVLCGSSEGSYWLCLKFVNGVLPFPLESVIRSC